MKNIKSVIGVFGLVILISCGKNSNKGNTSLNGKSKNSIDSIVILPENKGNLMENIRKNRIEMSDSVRVLTLIDGSFLKEAKSSPEEYVIYFNYLLGYSNEEYSEGIAQLTYDMFLKYPGKFDELDSLLVLLDNKSQGLILEEITNSLCYTLYLEGNEENQLSEKDFFNKFPYLKKKNCSKYFKRINDEFGN